MNVAKVFDPSNIQSTFSYGESASNFAAIIPTSVTRSLRQSILLDMHVRRSVQDRPYDYFNGAAEHLMLAPLSNLIMGKTDKPINFFLEMATDFTSISRAGLIGKGKTTGTAFSQVISGFLPDLSTGAAAGTFVNPGNSGTSYGFDYFSTFYAQLMNSSSARKSVFKTLQDGSFVNKNMQFPSRTPEFIQNQITTMEVFGMAGKRQPLYGAQVERIQNQRFVVESYLASVVNNPYDEDNLFAAAMWYLMYAQITRTPESYDSTFLAHPIATTDSAVLQPLLSLCGTLAQTAFTVGTSPVYLDAYLAIKYIEEAVEFLQTGRIYVPEESSKVLDYLSKAKAIISEQAYAPVLTLGNAIFDYLKKLTGARYLLPEFFTDYKSVLNSSKRTPFSALRQSLEVVVPNGYNGARPFSQRVTEFGGIDMPNILLMLQSKSSDLLSNMIDYSHIHDTIVQSLTKPSGSVVTHLDSLGSIDADPALGALEYAQPTRVYMTPSWIPKFKKLANSQLQWQLSTYQYKYIFPHGLQLSKLQNNLASQYFAWDTELNIPASATTGSDLGFLMVPQNYVEDCYSNSLGNDISSVGAYLSSSPRRPMSQIADYFTPVFQALSSGLAKPKVVANSLSSMFFLYQAVSPPTSDDAAASMYAQWQKEGAWTPVTPQIPFIYGYPTTDLMSLNEPWARNTRFPASIEHIKVSDDGRFMLVLHRALPKPQTLSYYPFMLEGGLSISLPVSREIFITAYNAARAKDLMSQNTADALDIPGATRFNSEFQRILRGVTPTGEVYQVKSWAPVVSLFPHIFVTNRHVERMQDAMLPHIFTLPTRYVLNKEPSTPYGGVLAFNLNPVVSFDITDMFNAFETNEPTIDIQKDLKTAKSKGTVNVQHDNELELKKPHDVETLGTTHEVVTDPKFSTEGNVNSKNFGKTKTTKNPPIPGAGTELSSSEDGPSSSEITD